MGPVIRVIAATMQLISKSVKAEVSMACSHWYRSQGCLPAGDNRMLVLHAYVNEHLQQMCSPSDDKVTPCLQLEVVCCVLLTADIL